MSTLTQSEANFLIGVQKFRSDDSEYEYPISGGCLRISLKSNTPLENFMLDISRGHIAMCKNTFQNRVRKTIVLVRLDLGGAPHRNPDHTEIQCPHIHLYREGYDDKWAYPLPENFSEPADVLNTLEEFMQYCNIIEKPVIKCTERLLLELGK